MQWNCIKHNNRTRQISNGRYICTRVCMVNGEWARWIGLRFDNVQYEREQTFLQKPIASTFHFLFVFIARCGRCSSKWLLFLAVNGCTNYHHYLSIFAFYQMHFKWPARRDMVGMVCAPCVFYRMTKRRKQSASILSIFCDRFGNIL